VKQTEYVEGEEATENFEGGMKALSKVSKDDLVKAERKRKGKASSRVSSVRKPHLSDKD